MLRQAIYAGSLIYITPAPSWVRQDKCMTKPSDHLQRLMDGYEIFRAVEYERQRERYTRLAAEGQRPPTMVIACSDSRVDPATVFHAAPGEMFVLRHIAALVPPCEKDGRHHSAAAAIEYAITQLEVEHVVVFGHGGCGGIAASLSGCFDHSEEGEGGFVHHWVETIRPERDRLVKNMPHASEEQRQLALELGSIKLSLGRLREFPGVAEREASGMLHLYGAHFDIRSGTLRMLAEGDGEFQTIMDEAVCAI